MHTTASSLVAIVQYFWRIRTSLFFVYQQKFNIEAVNNYPPIRFEICYFRFAGPSLQHNQTQPGLQWLVSSVISVQSIHHIYPLFCHLITFWCEFLFPCRGLENFQFKLNIGQHQLMIRSTICTWKGLTISNAAAKFPSHLTEGATTLLLNCAAALSETMQQPWLGLSSLSMSFYLH